MAEPTPQQIESAAARVREWVPRDFEWRCATKREHDRYFALALDFDITGRGDSPEEAVAEMRELLGFYLGSYLRDGVPFEKTLRPVPRRLRMRIHLSSKILNLLDRIDSRLEDDLPLPRERNYPVSELPVEAAAVC